jgi:hypothetical protein
VSEIKPSELLINKIQTTADGGVRVTFDFNPDDSHIIKRLMEKKLVGDDMIKCVFIEDRNGAITA